MTRTFAARAKVRARGPKTVLLLDFDGRARVRELLSNGLSFFLRHAFFDGLGSSFDEVLRFLQTQRGHFANDLDDVNFVATGSLKNDIEFSLLFSRRRSFT